jgi:DNA-binding SARP family transcriptional activator
LHYLRRVLGPDVIVGEGDEVAIRRDGLRCDAVAFEQLAIDGKAEEALALYQGDFMQGFHVPDVSSEYEEWVERTRARLRRRAAAVAWSAAESAERDGNGDRAVEHARRACELELDHEAGWRKLMKLQQRLGDRVGALRTYSELRDRLDKEFGVRPSAETIALAESIRQWNPAVAPIAAEAVAPSDESHADEQGTAPGNEAKPVAALGRRSSRPYAVASVLLLLAVLGGFAAMRARGEHRDVPSLVSSGALSARDRVVVGDFADGVGDTTLAAAVTQAVRVDLSQSPFVRVLSPSQLRSSLIRMQRSADLAIDDSLAREIALREGAKAYVIGAVAKVGSAFTVTAQLVSAERGDMLAAVRETAADSTKLIAALDRTTRALRFRIGESLRELSDAPALNQVTTPSLPALRLYTRGYRLFLDGHRSQAISYLQQAVALDTGFATAWRTIASIYGATDEPGRAVLAGQHAMANGNRLPFRERQFQIAGTAYGRGD